MNKIKKGDSVIVISGKDKGKKGEVIRLLEHNKCLVSAINMSKKHTKPNPNAGIEGGIIEKEMPIDYQILCYLIQLQKKEIESDSKNWNLVKKLEYINLIGRS